MKTLPKILMLLAALCLLALFVWPMWSITLYAPQYPSGVTMYIWINQISGDTPGTLQNINILNHYVGMKMIEPESIPELQYFQHVVFALVALGIGVALINRGGLFLAWAILLTILGSAGIFDFYLWEYDYGHNLSPDAPIKIAGMAYQPPLIGSKTLLNFIAVSWPYIGGWFIGVAILLSFLAFWFKRKQHKNSQQNILVKQVVTEKAHLSNLPFILMVLMLSIASCGPKEHPIEYGADPCDFCKMTIVDPQHSAELVTPKGRVFKFDAIECMLGFAASQKGDYESFALQLVADYSNKNQLIPAKEAFYLISPKVPSPMGANLSAFATETQARELIADQEGKVYSWAELIQNKSSLLPSFRQ